MTVQVRDRGIITLPSGLREKYDIESGKIFQLLDLDGVFVLVPMVSAVPQLARQIEKLREDAGLTLGEMLQGIREQRENYDVNNDGE